MDRVLEALLRKLDKVIDLEKEVDDAIKEKEKEIEEKRKKKRVEVEAFLQEMYNSLSSSGTLVLVKGGIYFCKTGAYAYDKSESEYRELMLGFKFECGVPLLGFQSNHGGFDSYFTLADKRSDEFIDNFDEALKERLNKFLVTELQKTINYRLEQMEYKIYQVNKVDEKYGNNAS